MFNDLREDQTIAIYRGGMEVFAGPVADIPPAIRDSEEFEGADFLLLSTFEACDVVAIY